MSKLYCLVGTIGSGKSTFATTMAKMGAIVCNDDSIVNAVHSNRYDLYNYSLKSLYKLVENTIVTAALGRGREVCVDRGTNIRRDSRRRFIGLAASLDCTPIAVVFSREAAEVHAERRFNSDSRGLSKAYWHAVAEKHLADWQEPSIEEGFDRVCYPTWEQIKNGKMF